MAIGGLNGAKLAITLNLLEQTQTATVEVTCNATFTPQAIQRMRAGQQKIYVRCKLMEEDDGTDANIVAFPDQVFTGRLYRPSEPVTFTIQSINASRLDKDSDDDDMDEVYAQLTMFDAEDFAHPITKLNTKVIKHDFKTYLRPAPSTT